MLLIPERLERAIAAWHADLNDAISVAARGLWRSAHIGWHPRHGVLLSREELVKAEFKVDRLPPHVSTVRLVEKKYA